VKPSEISVPPMRSNVDHPRSSVKHFATSSICTASSLYFVSLSIKITILIAT
jgi:hypothetical protein